MSPPKSRARWLRGALVGVCSAVVTTGAHTAGGGHVPQGATLALAVLICGAVGAVSAEVRPEGRALGLLAVIGALVAAQSLGHLTLTLASHHHDGGAGPTPLMAAAHLAAAVLLGAAINAVEYLYAVCASVLCWLRLFALAAQRPAKRCVRRRTIDVVAASVLRCPGLGMRAPPLGVASAA